MPIGSRIAFGFSILFFASQLQAQTIVSGNTPGEATVEQGAARYTIPIDVPEGLADMAPDLTITYSSQSGDGPLGIGWSLSGLPIIHRCAQNKNPDGKIIGINYTDTDRFCINGQRLIPVDGTITNHGGEGKEYRTEMDKFSRITAHKAAASTVNGPEYFTVEKADGNIETYGHVETLGTEFYNSRIDAAGRTDQAVSIWALGLVEDRSGNKMRHHYAKLADGEYRIQRIDYGYLDTANQAYARVQFDYQAAARLDATVRYSAGSAYSSKHLLDAIDLQVNQTGSWSSVRKYKLNYEAINPRQSRLASVQECSDAQCLKPTEISYNSDAEPSLIADPGTGLSSLYNGRDVLTFDYNGDGYQDILLRAMSGYHRVDNGCGISYAGHETYLVTGGPSGLSEPVDVTNAYGMSALSWSNAKVVKVFDSSPDGYDDLIIQGNHLVSSGGCSYATDNKTYHLVSDGVGFVKSDITQIGRSSGMGIPRIPMSAEKWSNATHRLHLFDSNGDGGSEILVQGKTSSETSMLPTRHGSIFIRFSQGVSGASLIPAAAWSYENTDIHALDINGDGLQDLLFHGKNTTETYIVFGLATSDTQTSDYLSVGTKISGLPGWGDLTAADWASREVFLVDHNGDGLSDVLLQGTAAQDTYLLLSTGTGFVKKTITTTAGMTAALWDKDKRTASVIDVNADGKSDLILQGKTVSDVSYLLLATAAGYTQHETLPSAHFAAANSGLFTIDANG